jgi:hypothetical protein
MRKLMVVLIMQLLWLAPLVVAGELGRAGELPRIIASDGNELTRDHTHFLGAMWQLGKWDNSFSSLIIPLGTWEFFEGDDFTGTKMAQLGTGLYPGVTERGLRNDSISSIRLVSRTAREAEGRRPC